MPVTISGTSGLAGVNGSASTPAVQGEDTNTGVFFPAADTVAVATGGTERARIDSSGNLLVGTTSAFASGFSNGSAQVQRGGTGPALFLRNNLATAGKFWQVGPDNSGNALVVYNQSSTGVYIADGSTSWTAQSDERLKTELVPFADAVAKVCSLRAGTGRYLTDEEDVSRSFLIAQDVKAVLPEAVDVKEDEQGTLGLRYTDVVPLLVAALKELKAEVDSLKAQLEAAQ
jgi:hypothetical protein